MKYIQQHITKKNILFIAIFAIIGFIALQIPVAQIKGSGAKFTVYDAFAPVAGSFIGSIPGVIAVFFMQSLIFSRAARELKMRGQLSVFFQRSLRCFTSQKKENSIL